MSEFMGRRFLLDNETGVRLYEKFAADMPICDYHCHLSAKDIADDRVFSDVGALMLEHDHYKWRLMRGAGVDEEFITGSRSFREKFIAYAGALEKAIGNPLFVWSNMEVRKYFGITEALTSENAGRIYDEINEKMKSGRYTARSFIRESNVAFIATTDDPSDNLDGHFAIATDDSFETKVVPTFRPDKVLAAGCADYTDYLSILGESAGMLVTDLDSLLEVLKLRMDHFAEAGCRISDHALSSVPDMGFGYEEASRIFATALNGHSIDGERTGLLSDEDVSGFAGFMLRFMAGEYYRRGWVMQVHLFALRNQNTKMAAKLGPDSGFDCTADTAGQSERLCRFLDTVSCDRGLPKMMIYTLEPGIYSSFVTVIGTFSSDFPGRIQLGPAWWFCDHIDGIIEQLKSFAAGSVLGYFNGMLTDSRSFLSYVRHDYFRRIFCSYVGSLVESGQYPDDEKLLGGIVRGVAYENASVYFGI